MKTAAYHDGCISKSSEDDSSPKASTEAKQSSGSDDSQKAEQKRYEGGQAQAASAGKVHPDESRQEKLAYQYQAGPVGPEHAVMYGGQPAFIGMQPGMVTYQAGPMGVMGAPMPGPMSSMFGSMGPMFAEMGMAGPDAQPGSSSSQVKAGEPEGTSGCGCGEKSESSAPHGGSPSMEMSQKSGASGSCSGKSSTDSQHAGAPEAGYGPQPYYGPQPAYGYGLAGAMPYGPQPYYGPQPAPGYGPAGAMPYGPQPGMAPGWGPAAGGPQLAAPGAMPGYQQGMPHDSGPQQQQPHHCSGGHKMQMEAPYADGMGMGMNPQHQYGQMIAMCNDLMQGKADPAKIASFLSAGGAHFWKGAVVGALVTFALKNTSVKSVFTNGMSSLFKNEAKDSAS